MHKGMIIGVNSREDEHMPEGCLLNSVRPLVTHKHNTHCFVYDQEKLEE
jgi:hypothetical protein